MGDYGVFGDPLLTGGLYALASLAAGIGGAIWGRYTERRNAQNGIAEAFKPEGETRFVMALPRGQQPYFRTTWNLLSVERSAKQTAAMRELQYALAAKEVQHDGDTQLFVKADITARRELKDATKELDGYRNLPQRDTVEEF